jgi:hypothetical protein
MIKVIFALLLSASLFSCSSDGNKGENGNKDFSNDEVILEEVNKIMKKDFSINDICINRPSEFKDLVLVGFFAHDRGCSGGLKFFKGKEVNNDTGYPAILNENGWKDKIKREVIALNWVKNVSLAWSIPLESEDEDFKKQEEYTFMPPTVTTNGDEISVAIWVREQSGKMAGASFHLLTVVFSIAEADIIRSQITDRFNVEY